MSPATCGECVFRNAAPEGENGACSVVGQVRGRLDPACVSRFPRDQLNGPVYGFAKGKTWPQLINGSGL